jgi:hypothetical protein
MSELFGGGGDLWFDEVEHARGKYRKPALDASGIIGRMRIESSLD